MHVSISAALHAAPQEGLEAEVKFDFINKGKLENFIHAAFNLLQFYALHHDVGSSFWLENKYVVYATALMLLCVGQSDFIPCNPIFIVAIFALMAVAFDTNLSLLRRANMAMLSYVRKHTIKCALLIIAGSIPVIHGASIGDDNMQPRDGLSRSLTEIGIFFLISVIVFAGAMVVRGCLYLATQGAAEKLELSGEATTNNTIFQAVISLFFCFGSISMFDNYLDPQSFNAATWFVFFVFVSETVVFHYYHFNYHKEENFGQKLMPLLVGTVLTLFLWITNHVSFGPLAFWTSIAVCPWLHRLGSVDQDGASWRAGGPALTTSDTAPTRDGNVGL